MKRTLSLLALTSLLAACSVLPKPDVETRYVLNPFTPTSTASPVAASTTQVLGIPRPQVPFELRGSKLALIENGTLTFYEGQAWSAPLPDMLQTALVRDLSAALPGWVVSGNNGLTRTLELQMDVQDFATVKNGNDATVQMTFNLRVVDPLKRTVLKHLPFHYQENLEKFTISNTMQAYNTGWQQAVQALLSLLNETR